MICTVVARKTASFAFTLGRCFSLALAESLLPYTFLTRNPVVPHFWPGCVRREAPCRGLCSVVRLRRDADLFSPVLEEVIILGFRNQFWRQIPTSKLVTEAVCSLVRSCKKSRWKNPASVHLPPLHLLEVQVLKNEQIDWECPPWPDFPMARDLCQKLLAFEPEVTNLLQCTGTSTSMLTGLDFSIVQRVFFRIEVAEVISYGPGLSALPSDPFCFRAESEVEY